MKYLSILLFILTSARLAIGQCPTIDFTINDEVCQNQQISIANNTVSANDYEWDYCADDLTIDPLSNIVLNNSDFARARSVRVIEEDGNWYGFALSQTANNIMRFAFGSDPSNTPTYSDLGTFDDIIDRGYDIEAIQVNGIWNLLVASTGDGNIIRFEFDGGLDDMTPTVTSLGDFGVLSAPSHILAIEDDSKIHLLISDGNQLHTIQFNNSLDDPSPTTQSYNVSGSSNLRGLSLVKECDIWVGIILSYSSNELFSVEFGNSLLNVPTFNKLNTDGSGFRFPANIKIINERGEFFAFTIGATGDFHRIRLGESLSSFSFNIDEPEITNITGDQNFALDIIKYNSQLHLFSFNLDQRSLIRLSFDNNCSVMNPVSVNESPEPFYYEESGKYYIVLKATDTGGNESYKLDSITVTPNTAPDISFTSQNNCQAAPIQFISQSSSGGLTYAWDFGDSNSSTDANPSHTFAAAGEYEVTLEVTDGTCENFVKETVIIYDEPAADFSAPVGVMCTNQEVTFTNDTPGEFGDSETYEWQVDGVPVAATRDLVDYQFATDGMKQVKLIVSIPGCSDEFTQNVNIEPGPSPDFTVNDNCVGTLFQFTNQTTGSATSYNWDFDNGFFSSEETPAPFEYSDPGTYNVTLTILNALGCETSITKPLTVYELPIVDFDNELACEGSPTLFTDRSAVSDANIETWQWSFDDPSSGSNNSVSQNPEHIFSTSGSFDVKLITSTTFGCIDSLTQTVTVLPAPSADFSFENACIGELIQFEDDSQPVTGETLTSWAWDLGGTFSAAQNPQATFENAVDYLVSLTVTSENLCINTVQKTVSIKPPVMVDFEVDKACSDVVQLYDVSPPTGDPIASYDWDFDGLATAQDSVATFNEMETGTYDVNLAVTTERGCEYEAAKSVVVNDEPEAAFSSSVLFGSPPLEVEFSSSSEAIAYDWDFKDGNTSSGPNPSHIFVEEGIYDVQLIITDENGCEGMVTQSISVVEPNLEIELQGLSIVNNRLVLTIVNNGTLTIDSLKASIAFGNQLELEETIHLKIPPSNNPQPINHTLSLNLASQRLSYLCVTLESFLEEIKETDFTNNSKCENFQSQIVIEEPYPNPSTGQINLRLVSEITSTIKVIMLDEMGSEVLNKELNGEVGVNDYLLDVSHLKNGVYLLQITMGSNTLISRMAISN